MSDRLSLLPLVTGVISKFDHKDNEIGIKIENNGAGPAIIRSFEVYADNKSISFAQLRSEQFSDFTDACKKHKYSFEGCKIHTTSFEEGDAILNGQSKSIFYIIPDNTTDDATIEAFFKKINDLHMSVFIHYCSLMHPCTKNDCYDFCYKDGSCKDKITKDAFYQTERKHIKK